LLRVTGHHQRKEFGIADYVLMIHKNKNFTEWKKGYDANLPNRVAAGLTELNLLQGESDPNQVVLLFKTSNLAKTKAFAQSPELKATMDKAGVIGEPDVHFFRGK
jgi:hypothetical protein